MMVTLVKHEYHQVDSQFAFELDEDKLSEIYPDLKKKEIKKLLKDIEDGETTIDSIMDDAWDNDVEILWERQYDDWWTDRKGGYDISYELGDENSWHTQPQDPPPTHKCTKCRWEGKKYEANYQYLREDGTVIEDYYNSDEEYHSEKKICPMCDSDTELTEEGIRQEEEQKKFLEEFDKSDDE